MFAKILSRVMKTSDQSERNDAPVFGRLVAPGIPSWSYPADEHFHRGEKKAKPMASPSPTHEGPERKKDEEQAAEVRGPRLARLPGLPLDVLLPVRQGHDYVGGMIASLCVVTAGITLLLLELT